MSFYIFVLYMNCHFDNHVKPDSFCEIFESKYDYKVWYLCFLFFLDNYKLDICLLCD